MTRWLVAAAVLTVAVAHASARAQKEPPLTPGRLALMVSTATDVVTPLWQAIGSSSAPLRTTAARIIAVSKITALMPEIVVALPKETDARAQEEMVRALVLFDSDDGGRVLDALLPTLPLSAVQVMAKTMAQGTPDRLVERLPAIRAGFGDRALAVVGTALQDAELLHPEERGKWLRAALSVANGPSWASFMGRLSERDPASVDVAVITSALESVDEGVREATVWHLTLHADDDKAIAAPLIDAATRSVGRPDAPETWELFGREILARVHRRARTPDRSALIRRDALTRLRSDQSGRPTWSVLTENERAALRAAIGAEPWANTILEPERTEAIRAMAASKIGPPRFKSPSPPPAVRMRSINALVPGFLEDLFTASGCAPGNEPRFAAIVATYRPDGRIGGASLDLGTLQEKCKPALAALTHVFFNDGDAPVKTGQKESVVVPLWRAFNACTDVMRGVSDVWDDSNFHDLTRVTSVLKEYEPRKAHDQRPYYPPNALSTGVQGILELRASIASSGCIRDIVITKSPSQLLDFSAFQAVLQWRYRPLPAEFKGADVTMTVTVQFTIG